MEGIRNERLLFMPVPIIANNETVIIEIRKCWLISKLNFSNPRHVKYKGAIIILLNHPTKSIKEQKINEEEKKPLKKNEAAGIANSIAITVFKDKKVLRCIFLATYNCSSGMLFIDATCGTITCNKFTIIVLTWITNLLANS